MTCRQIENLFEMERMADKYWNNRRAFIVTGWIDLLKAVKYMDHLKPGAVIRLPKGVKPKDIITSATEEYVF